MLFSEKFKQILKENSNDEKEDFLEFRKQFVNTFTRRWNTRPYTITQDMCHEEEIKSLFNILLDKNLTSKLKLAHIDQEYDVTMVIDSDLPGFELTPKQADIILNDILEWAEENLL